MHCVRKISEDTFWIGGNDRRLALFENVYPIPSGVSYNSYIIKDDKVAVLDTVDKAVSSIYFENIAHVMGGRAPDYLIINHMEPDHAATIGEFVLRYPDTALIANAKTVAMIKQYFDFNTEGRVTVVKEGDTLDLGKHKLTFVATPMVHWPEVMMTYDATDKVLYSADAFGTFGTIDGGIFADEVDFKHTKLDEARRYYTNIVGKYGVQVQAALKKAASIKIDMICPLHGYVWRKDIGWFIEKYNRWSTYTPEVSGVMIAYASVYGNTENAVNILASKLAEKGVKNIAVYDVSVTHSSYILSEAFKYSHIVFASTTYNAGIFVNMENLINDIVAHNLKGRNIALIENGSWAPTSGNLMRDALSKLGGTRFVGDTVTLRSAVKDTTQSELERLAQTLADEFKSDVAVEPVGKVDNSAMFKIGYGLYVLTAKTTKQNGCIVNAVVQVTDSPKQIAVTVNKSGYTHEQIISSKEFNLSVLSVNAPFETYKDFGFVSGRDTDKLVGMSDISYSDNGIAYLNKNATAMISCHVVQSIDLGSHTMFIAEVIEAKQLDNDKSVTYDYYFDNIKPKPAAVAEKKKGYVCKICGYVYEGDKLPDDYVCPLCKHGAADFEPLK
ncbi:MAG: flavin reductase [Clostridia bacterium]|nr:flavin reductase [Clostridia bacterium]